MDVRGTVSGGREVEVGGGGLISEEQDTAKEEGRREGGIGLIDK